MRFMVRRPSEPSSTFPVSGYRFGRPFIRALGLIKWAAAQANRDLLDSIRERARLIVQAAEEVVDGQLDRPFSD